MNKKMVLFVLSGMLCLIISSCGGGSGGGSGSSGGTNISGKVWRDQNQDKMVNPNETGIPSIKVNLYRDSNGNNTLDSTDESVATTNADWDGNYGFNVTAPGTYFISVDTQSGMNGLTTESADTIMGPSFVALRINVTNVGANIGGLNFGFVNGTNFGVNPAQWNFDISANRVAVNTEIDLSQPFPFVSSPAVAPDGTLYIGSGNASLYAVNPDGTVKWKYETGGSIGASPAIGSDGTIYFGSVDRQVYALNPDGSLKWIVPTRSRFTSSAAIAADGTIYVAGIQGDKTILCAQTPPTVVVQYGELYAISPSGTLKWSRLLSGVVYSSPAVAGDGTVYIGSNGDFGADRSNPCDPKSPYPPSNLDPGYPVNGHLYAVNPDGSLKWSVNTQGDVNSSPAIGVDGTIYVGSHYATKAYGVDAASLIDVGSVTIGYLNAINPNGTVKWVMNLFGDVDSSPAVGLDGTIYVGSDDFHVWALNPNGTVKWVSPTRDYVKSSPALAADGTIYIGSNDGSLYAFNADGTVKARFAIGGKVNSSPSIGVDGSIYFATGGGDDKLYSIIGDSVLAPTSWPKFRRDLPNTGRK